ncbi:hypothetical protein [Qipengyuania zhejiangensis]|uniref:hypothetical protein n=1 Tax=Qipengyuania zhejiangensis TaxID=3077782 RepID=UPI002D78E810|nr:hypothetical protein [Qipengyuania sp. Z2]
MEDGLFTNHGKKLLMVGLFLLCVALLVGGEDDPGMIAQMNERVPGASTEPAAMDLPVQVATKPASPRPNRRSSENLTLEQWYADASPPEVLDPEPVDESYLIDDTAPMVDPTPQTY